MVLQRQQHQELAGGGGGGGGGGGRGGGGGSGLGEACLRAFLDLGVRVWSLGISYAKE